MISLGTSSKNNEPTSVAHPFSESQISHLKEILTRWSLPFDDWRSSESLGPKLDFERCVLISDGQIIVPRSDDLDLLLKISMSDSMKQIFGRRLGRSPEQVTIESVQINRMLPNDQLEAHPHPGYPLIASFCPIPATLGGRHFTEHPGANPRVRHQYNVAPLLVPIYVLKCTCACDRRMSILCKMMW